VSKFRVHVTYPVGQCITVDADDIEDAKQLACEGVDLPNISNKFEEAGDPEAVVVFDDHSNELLWAKPDTQEETAS
jgi:hypothetical protein